MKTLSIVWKHYDKSGKTCNRCGRTGANIRQVIAELAPTLAKRGVSLVYHEEKLGKDSLDQSNVISFNGKPLEHLIVEAREEHTPCQSCSYMIGKDVSCRAVQHNGIVYEDIPKDLLIEAIHQHVAGWS